jgi:ABC-2 type transport system permease protein
MRRLLSKLIALLKIYIADSLAYRASAFIWMLTDVVHCLVMPLVWLSAYGGRETIAGYNPGEMVTYYVMIAFTTNFIVSHLMWDLSMEIKEGVLSQWLLRPVPVAWMLFARNISWRAMRMVLFVPVAILALWYYSRLTTLSPLYLGWEFWLSVLLGHLVSFWVAYALACLAFWLQETQSVFSLYYAPMLLLSGWVAPIALMHTNRRAKVRTNRTANPPTPPVSNPNPLNAPSHHATHPTHPPPPPASPPTTHPPHPLHNYELWRGDWCKVVMYYPSAKPRTLPCQPSLSLHRHAPAVVLAAERVGNLLQKRNPSLQLVGAGTVVSVDHQQPFPACGRLDLRLVAHILQRQRSKTRQTRIVEVEEMLERTHDIGANPSVQHILQRCPIVNSHALPPTHSIPHAV